MAYYGLTIDLSGVETLVHFHEVLKTAFGFPDFYGKNIHALIDCLSSLRQPEDGMSTFTLMHPEDVLILKVNGLSKKKWVIVDNFLIAIEQVNNREQSRGLYSSILLKFVTV